MEPLRWSALEYADKEHSTDWFWGLGLITLVGVGICVYFENYLLSVLVLVAGVSFAIFSIRKPRIMGYEITDDGVRIQDIFYPFNTLESFWVTTEDTENETPKLILESKKFFIPHITIPINDYDPKTVSDFLIRYLPKVEHHEPFIHILAERLGF